MNNNYRKNKGKKPEHQGYQASKRYGHLKYEDRRGQNFNSFKQNNDGVEEKEMVGNEDKLSNVSTANSDKKNQMHEEEIQYKRLDYEFHIISEIGESFVKIENV